MHTIYNSRGNMCTSLPSSNSATNGQSTICTFNPHIPGTVPVFGLTTDNKLLFYKQRCYISIFNGTDVQI